MTGSVEHMSVNTGIPITSAPRYARFSRRVRAIAIDLIIAWAIIFGALALAITVSSDNFSRVLGFTVVAILLLYEPLLVSLTGSTLGHYFTNLRVVDDGGGNISLLKACARLIIKGLLSWYSFVILAATRRNQALHDVLTRSTVQIRNPSMATPDQYIGERIELAAPDMPSRLRRVLVIGAYLVVALAVFTVATDGIETGGALSGACVNNGYCSAAERMLDLVIGVALLLMTALIITMGWRGRLFGARRT